jgi:hypothetical protein
MFTAATAVARENLIYLVKTVKFVSDRMSYIIIRGHWCHCIFLNVHDPAEDETDGAND